jgi:hypothetical protein
MNKTIKEVLTYWEAYKHWYYNESKEIRMPTMEGFMDYLAKQV